VAHSGGGGGVVLKGLALHLSITSISIVCAGRIHDLQALEEAGKRAGLRQLQQEGILIVENCTMQSASESPEEGTGRMTVDIRLPQKALSSVSPGQSFDVILVASGTLFCALLFTNLSL
jgi:hypothetical protein